MINASADYLLSWEGAFQTGIDLDGGKGWNLSRLARYGFRIPGGCILAVKAYRDFFDLNQFEGF